VIAPAVRILARPVPIAKPNGRAFATSAEEIMASCPECDAEIEVDEFDVDKGDQLSCPECGSNLEVVSLSPLELDLADDDDEDEEEEDDDDDLDEDDDDFDGEDDEEGDTDEDEGIDE
jgi:alpha-aminoadipate/glutamate carrier protein LysW